MRTCSICGRTSEETRIISKNGVCYCRKHYLQLYRHGKILSRTIYDEQTYNVEGDKTFIHLYNTKGTLVDKVIIDTEDLEKVLKYKWHLKKSHGTRYACSSIKNHKVFLHQVVLDYFGKDDVDHVNGNGLDNRKENLRIIPHAFNIMNQQHKDHVGVKLLKSGRYSSRVMYHGKSLWLGVYATQEEAVGAREKKIKELLSQAI